MFDHYSRLSFRGTPRGQRREIQGVIALVAVAALLGAGSVPSGSLGATSTIAQDAFGAICRILPTACPPCKQRRSSGNPGGGHSTTTRKTF